LSPRIDSDRMAPIGLDLKLLPRLQASVEARSALRRAFSGRLPVKSVESLLTIVSELVTNAVVHGPGKPIGLTVTAEPDGSIRGEVCDQGQGKVAIREIEDDRPGGMGLRIVRALADRWGVRKGSTRVWFELDADVSSRAGRT
jgi:anti-sigma regulatory factor (Ser/Thr protein kinase)